MKKNILWKTLSFAFNPLFIPLWCVLLYYLLTPQLFSPQEVAYTIMVVALATLAIPLSAIFLLKVAGKVESISLHNTYERRLPLLLVCLLLICAVRFYLSGVVSQAISLALVAAALSVLIAYLFSLWRNKISLHAMGMAGLVCFLAMMMMKWGAPLSYALPALIPALLAYDLVVIARMELGRHNARQIILGTIAGALPQVIIFTFLYKW